MVTTSSLANREPDAALVNLLARAHAFLATLIAAPGRSLTDVAALHATDLASVCRILPYAFLAPALTEAILAGRQSPSLTAQRLLRMPDLAILWADQIAAMQ